MVPGHVLTLWHYYPNVHSLPWLFRCQFVENHNSEPSNVFGGDRWSNFVWLPLRKVQCNSIYFISTHAEYIIDSWIWAQNVNISCWIYFSNEDNLPKLGCIVTVQIFDNYMYTVHPTKGRSLSDVEMTYLKIVSTGHETNEMSLWHNANIYDCNELRNDITQIVENENLMITCAQIQDNFGKNQGHINKLGNSW